MTQSYDAVVLAGGAGRRLGGAGKPGLEVGGRTLLQWVLAAVAGAERRIVVGPDPRLGGLPDAAGPPGAGPPGAGSPVAGGPPGAALPVAGGPPGAALPVARRAPVAGFPGPGAGLPDIVVVREEPPGGGPVPALRRGVAEVSAPLLVLLAADLPFLRSPHVQALVAACGGADGAVLVDDEGRQQWLAGCWRAEALRAALVDYRGDSLRGVLGGLAAVLVPGSALAEAGELEPWRDCDTPEDLALARERYT